MRVRSTTEPGPRIAFITSVKVFKRSVDRNRVKRRMREVVRELLPGIPINVHLLFVLKPEGLKASHSDLKAEVARLLSKISEALLKPPKMSPGAMKRAAKSK